MSNDEERMEQVSSSQDEPENEAAREEETRLANTKLIGVVRNIDELKKELLIECNRRPYLDGTYFVPDLNRSSVDGTIVGICQLCKTDNNKHHTINGSLKVSSNYTSHIQKVHKKRLHEYDEYAGTKQKKLKSDNEVEKLKTYCTFSQAKFEENVINYILESLAPFNTVESVAFRKIFDDMAIKKGGRALSHLSARTVARKAQDTFQENVCSIKKELSTVKYVCTTADIWSSHSRRFIGMTVHWIDEHIMERKSHAIACRRFTGVHSYDRIARIIEDIHTSYGIDVNKVVATVTDNGSNFVKAFNEFGINFGDSFFYDGVTESPISPSNDLESESEMEHAEPQLFEYGNEEEVLNHRLPQHFRCASHTLNLVATTDTMAGIKASEDLNSAYNGMIERCNYLWKLLASPKKNEQLKKLLGAALKRPVVTRWNSMYDSLSQILDLKDQLTRIRIVQDTGLQNPLREMDFRFIEEYIQCTRPLAEAIDILQGEKICAYGYLLPTLISIRNKLLNCSRKNLPFCKNLVFALIRGVNTRFKKFFDVEGEGRVSAVAAASHPKFKLKWLSCLSHTAQANVLAAIKDAIASNTQRVDDQRPVQNESEDLFFDFTCASEEGNIIENTFGTNDPEILFQKFSTETRCDLELLNVYPSVKEIFLKFNTPLPSSAAVERLFSYATMFNLPKYNRLTDENFELRVLMKSNAGTR